MKLKVIRLNYSSYHYKDFLNKEASVFASLGVGYDVFNSSFKVEKGFSFILISNTHTCFDQLPQELLDQTSLVIHPNSGHENISMAFLKRTFFPIVVGNTIRANAVADYILGKIHDRISFFPHADKWDFSRFWDRDLTSDLEALIIGMGEVGKRVYERLVPQLKSIECLDPDKGYIQNDLKKVVGKSNIVILSCGLNPTSKRLVDSFFLKALPNNFLLINTARGELIDEQALIEVLNQRPNAQAVLDVFVKEPFSENDFKELKYSNLKCSSHIAGVYKNLDKDIIKFCKNIVRDFISSEDIMQTKYKGYFLRERIRDGYLI